MEKACIFCRHFYMDAGTPDWSDVTPGEAASVGCFKGIWALYYCWDEAEWREGMSRANDCPWYEYVPLSSVLR